MPAAQGRTDILVRLVARCDTAPAHANPPHPALLAPPAVPGRRPPGHQPDPGSGLRRPGSSGAARQPARRLAMKRGQKLTVDQTLKALMMVSANDVAVMLAEAAGGSVARFSRAMDAESARLRLRASSRRNPHRLDAPGHRSTAFDLAILARAVLEDRWKARVVHKSNAAFTNPSG